MKFIASFILAITLLSTSAFASNLEQREAAKKQLTKIHNSISKMSSEEYTDMMGKLASAAADHGMLAEAKLFEDLKKDPASQFEISGQLLEKLDNASENGIFFIIYMLYPQGWCYVGDITCGFGVAFLSILTLEGEQAAEF